MASGSVTDASCILQSLLATSAMIHRRKTEDCRKTRCIVTWMCQPDRELYNRPPPHSSPDHVMHLRAEFFLLLVAEPWILMSALMFLCMFFVEAVSEEVVTYREESWAYLEPTASCYNFILPPSQQSAVCWRPPLHRTVSACSQFTCIVLRF